MLKVGPPLARRPAPAPIIMTRTVYTNTYTFKIFPIKYKNYTFYSHFLLASRFSCSFLTMRLKLQR